MRRSTKATTGIPTTRPRKPSAFPPQGIGRVSQLCGVSVGVGTEVSVGVAEVMKPLLVLESIGVLGGGGRLRDGVELVSSVDGSCRLRLDMLGQWEECNGSE